MKFRPVFSLVVVWAVILLALVSLPAGAVTWLTVNTLTSGSITTPGTLAMRCDTSAAGARVRLVAGSDLNANGQLDAGEPVIWPLGSVQDGGWTDEDATTKVVRLTYYAHNPIRGSLVVQALDEDGSTVGHAYSFDYTHPAQSVSGTVLKDLGAAAAGVMVVAGDTVVYPWWGGDERQMQTACITDAGGNYKLYLPPGRHPLMVATQFAGNLSPPAGIYPVPLVDWVTLAASEAKTGKNFTLHSIPGPKIVGSVREADTARPVPGALVMGQLMTNSAYNKEFAFTDIDGRYELHAWSGSWYVDVRQHGGRGEVNFAENMGPYQSVWAPVTVGASDVTKDFSLPRLSNRIYGIVTGSGGIAIPSAHVDAQTCWKLWPPTFLAGRTVNCNGQRHYEVWVDIPPWDCYNVVAADVGRNYSPLSPGETVVTVPPDQRVDFPFLAWPYTVSGRVTLAGSGAGAPYARVWAWPTGEYAYANRPWAFTDGQGYYSMKVPPSTLNLYCNCRCAPDVAAGPTGLAFPPNHTGQNLSITQTHFAPTLSAGGVSPSSSTSPGTALLTFTVTYTSADNMPPADVYVVIDSWPRPMAPTDPSDTNYADGATYQCQRTLTTGTHTFWFGAIDALGLNTRLPAATTYSVTVPANGILGRVKDKDTGQGVSGVAVKAYLGSVLKGSTTTGADGIYSISGAGWTTGTYKVTASKDGYVTYTWPSISFTAGQIKVVNFFLFEKSGKLTGTVKWGSSPIPNATVSAYLNGTVLKASATTGADGWYTISRDLPAGTYKVTAGADGYITGSQTNVTVTKGATTTVNFSLLKSGKLTGTVKNNVTSAAIPGATVQAYLNGTVLKGSAATGAYGGYNILRDLPTGTYKVTASKTGYVTSSQTGIAVTQGSTTTVNFQL